jgi:hypothetical protein
MTPTDFEFTVTIPSDVRLLEAIRLLAIQAGGYAKLTADASAALAAGAAREAEAAMKSSRNGQAPIECLFAGDDNAVTITISSEGRTRHIRQPVSA